MGISLFTITLLVSYAGDSEYLLIKIFIQKNLIGPIFTNTLFYTFVYSNKVSNCCNLVYFKFYYFINFCIQFLFDLLY